jgi:ABC-type sugar transport system ATPase subunit
MIAAAERIIEAAGIDVDVRRRTGSYDFSRRQAIEIARACLATLHIVGVATPLILLDEPTSALDQRDEEAFFRLVERMRAIGSLIFVSHRMSEVLSLSDEIHVLKDGRLVASLDAADADEATLHELMVGRERVADYYHEGRQQTITASDPVVLSLRGINLKAQYEEVDLRCARWRGRGDRRAAGFGQERAWTWRRGGGTTIRGRGRAGRWRGGPPEHSRLRAAAAGLRAG